MMMIMMIWLLEAMPDQSFKFRGTAPQLASSHLSDSADADADNDGDPWHGDGDASGCGALNDIERKALSWCSYEQIDRQFTKSKKMMI